MEVSGRAIGLGVEAEGLCRSLWNDGEDVLVVYGADEGVCHWRCDCPQQRRIT
jgi:hypothetical protein